jgi:hypothetical protein
MPNKQRSTTDPMAEDELNDILTEFAFGIIHLQKELEHDKKHHTFTATHGHRDKALAAINAYTTNKIIEARGGGLNKPSDTASVGGNQVVALPPYVNENGRKYWLTLTQDIRGDWSVGYTSEGTTYLEWSAIGENQSIDEALSKLATHYQEYRDAT